MKIFYKDGCRYIYITGYGCLSRNFLARLAKYEDMDIFIQGIGREWEAVEPNLISSISIIPRHSDQKEWDLTFHLMPPPFIEKLKGINFCYTQNAISRLMPSWKETLKKMELVIVPSKFDKEVFAKEGIKNLEIVPQSSDHEIFVPAEPPPKNPFIFLNVGTLNFRKGQDILLQAFKMAFGDNPEVQLYFKPGRGSFQALFQQLLVEVGLKGDNVVLDERLDSPLEMVNLYHKVHCVVNPSRGEGWNMPITEGMCCELPTISTYATAMLEYMTDQNSFPVKATPKKIKSYETTWWSKGWLTGYADIPEGRLYEVDPKDLAETMTKVYEHYDKAKERGVQGRKDIIEKWSWNQATEKLHEVIINQFDYVKTLKRGMLIEETRKIPDMELK